MLDKLYPAEMDEDQPRLLTTILTCEGDMRDPSFPHRLQSLVGKLKRLISEEKKPFCIKKVEPWNSVRVTFTIPWDAALRLRQLAQQGDQVLRDLGILSVQIEGDQAITLTLANRYNGQELVFKTSGACNDTDQRILNCDHEAASGDKSSSPIDAQTLGQLLVKAINPSIKAELADGKSKSSDSENDILDEKVEFQSPNVVAPSCSSPPPFKTRGSFSPKANCKAPVNGGPFPFASMTHAMNTKQAAASSQNAKHVHGCSSRFPFTPPLQISASSAWLPYVSQKTNVTDSSVATSITSDTTTNQLDVISTAELQSKSLTCSNMNYNSLTKSATPKPLCKNSSQNAILSSPFLVNLLQNESSSNGAENKETSSLSPTFQPPVKRRKRSRKSKEMNMPLTSQLLNSPTVFWPSLSAKPLILPETLNTASTVENTTLCTNVQPTLPLSIHQSKIINQNPIVYSQSALRSPPPRYSLDNAPSPATSSHTCSAHVATSTTQESGCISKASSPVVSVPERPDRGVFINCTPFPSPPPSADGKVKHLINPFTGQLEPMPSEDDDDDVCIGPLSLFPELEMMDTNENNSFDKSIRSNPFYYNKVDDSKVPFSEDMLEKSKGKFSVNQSSSENPKAFTLRNQVPSEISDLKLRSNDLKSKFVNNNKTSFSLQAAGIETHQKNYRKKLSTVARVPVETLMNEMPKVKTVVAPLVKDKLPCSAQVSQVDLSFLQPHLQKIKSVYKNEDNSFQTINETVNQKFDEIGVSLECFQTKLSNTNAFITPKSSANLCSRSILMSKSGLDSLKGTPVFFVNQKVKNEGHANLLSSQSLNNVETSACLVGIHPGRNGQKETKFTVPVSDSQLIAHEEMFSCTTSGAPISMESDGRIIRTYEQNKFDHKILLNQTASNVLPYNSKGLAPGKCMKDIPASGSDEMNENVIRMSNCLAIGKEKSGSENHFSTSPKDDICLSSSVCNTPESLSATVSCEKDALTGLDACLNTSTEFSQRSLNSCEIKDLKISYNEYSVSPANSPHFETPPNSRSPISLGISNSDSLSTDSIVSSFDEIQKGVVFKENNLQLVCKNRSFNARMDISSNENEKVTSFSEHSLPDIGFDSYSNSLTDSSTSCSQQSAINIPSLSDAVAASFYPMSMSVTSAIERKCEPIFKSSNKVSPHLIEPKLGGNNVYRTATCNSVKKSCGKVENLDSFFSLNANNDINAGNSKQDFTCEKKLDTASVLKKSYNLVKTRSCNSFNNSSSVSSKCENSHHIIDSNFLKRPLTIYGKPHSNFIDNQFNGTKQEEPTQVEKDISNKCHTTASNTLFTKSPHIVESCSFSTDSSSSAQKKTPLCVKDLGVDIPQQRSVNPRHLSESSDLLLLSSTEKPKIYTFMDSNISKPPEQLPLEIFENSDSGSQSPASSEGESAMLSGTSLKQKHNIFSVNCSPIESHLSSQVLNTSIFPPLSKTRECDTLKHSASDVVWCHDSAKGKIPAVEINTSTFESRCIVSSNNATVQNECIFTTSLPNVPLCTSSVPKLSLNPAKTAVRTHSGKLAKCPTFQNSVYSSDNNCRATKCLLTPMNSIPLNERNPRIVSSLNLIPRESSDEFGKKLNCSDVLADISISFDSVTLPGHHKNESGFSISSNKSCTGEYQNALQIEPSFDDVGKKVINISNAYKGSLKTECFPFKKRCGDHNIIFSKIDNTKIFEGSTICSNFSRPEIVPCDVLSSVDEKLVNEIKHKLNIGKDLKFKNGLSADDSFSSTISNINKFDGENCVAIISAEKLELPIKKSSYDEKLFHDYPGSMNCRNSEPVNIEYRVHQYKFEGCKSGSFRPELTNNVCKILQSNHVDSVHLKLDELPVRPKYNGSLSFTSLPVVDDSKTVNESGEGNLISAGCFRPVNESCAMMDVKASFFDGMKVTDASESCILTNITGEKQVGGVKRRRLSADSLR